LGCSRQAVWQLLSNYGRDLAPPILLCCHCGAEVLRGNRRLCNNGPVSCLDCLARRRPTQFGERLKAFRLAAGVSQRRLARHAGVSVTNLGKLEGGRKGPMWDTLLKLVGVLGDGLVTLDIGDWPPHGA